MHISSMYVNMIAFYADDFDGIWMCTDWDNVDDDDESNSVVGVVT